jgi:hypothetical protein
MKKITKKFKEKATLAIDANEECERVLKNIEQLIMGRVSDNCYDYLMWSADLYGRNSRIVVSVSHASILLRAYIKIILEYTINTKNKIIT